MIVRPVTTSIAAASFWIISRVESVSPSSSGNFLASRTVAKNRISGVEPAMALVSDRGPLAMANIRSASAAVARPTSIVSTATEPLIIRHLR